MDYQQFLCVGHISYSHMGDNSVAAIIRTSNLSPQTLLNLISQIPTVEQNIHIANALLTDF